MAVRELVSAFVAVAVLAGLAVSVKPGSAAPAVLNAGFSGGSNLIKAAAYGS